MLVMEDDDIRALLWWHHGEPNFREDAMRHTAMDRILSNSFMETLRVQNLFNTAARPRKPQRDVAQPTVQPQSNVYVPGGRVSVEAPQRSSLTPVEQKEYLRLYLAYRHKGKNALHKQEDNMFNMLHQKVVEENVKYEEFVQAQMLETEDVCKIPDDVVKYTSRAWQLRLAAVAEYPASYRVVATLPLVVSSLDGSLVRLKLEHTLLQLGELPVISPPQFKSKLCCSGAYDDLCRDYPVQECVAKMCQVSRDPAAERLAAAHGADVVVSSSALLHIADNYPQFDRVWDIPVVIRQVQAAGDAGNMKKVIFIDKVLPPTTLTAEQRTLWFCKVAAKKMFCRQNSATAKCPAKRPKYVAKKINKSGFPEMQRRKTAPQQVDDGSGSEVPSRDSEDAESTDDASANDSASANENVKDSASQTRASVEARLSEDSGEKNTNSADAMLQGVKRKQVESRSGSDHEGSDDSGSGLENKLVIVCQDEEADRGETREEDAGGTWAAKKQRLQRGGDSESEPAGGSGGRQRGASAASEETRRGAGQVQYNLWHLCLQEGEKEDLKERFLKQKVKNKHLKVLVRCTVDGLKTVDGKLQKLCIVPKLEHKLQYGAERLSTSEIIRSWLMLYLRPGVDLARVRVDAKTSEVVMFEETKLKEVAEYASASQLPVQSVTLGALYNVLTALDNYAPGTYLMSHRRDCFFNLLQADVENGRYDLGNVYKVNCCEVSPSRRPQYLPIDPAVVMPRNVLCGRVPATFNPKKPGNPAKKKKKNKNKKKMIS